MKSNRSVISLATLYLSLLSLNLESIASNQISGPFDIPLKSVTNATTKRELNHLRAGVEREEKLMDEKSSKQETQKKTKQKIPQTPEEKDEARKLRAERMKERRERAKKIIMEHQPEAGQLNRMSAEEIKRVYGNVVKNDPTLEKEDNKWLRNLGRNLQYATSTSYGLADIGAEYDQWAQGYRMLGGFIDCDHDKDEGSGDNNGGNACSRWMMWAAYVNPNYQGGGRSEYFSDSYNYYGQQATSTLDCHTDSTDWVLLGVYREEFYQYIEQISKHLWAIDEYEYVVALAGLAYMTDEDCYGVGYDNNGNYLYAGVQPQYGGKFQMSIYTDNKCLELDKSSGNTFDDFGLTSDMDLGSKDDGTLSDDELYTLYGYWKNAQEYTLSLLNEVYEEFKYCTLCMDYPTYQDGYFIGDYGTDDDDLINQCWKFHSHDSFTCESDCLSLGDAQGTITKITYLGKSYGQSWDGSAGGSSPSSSPGGVANSSGYKTSSVSKFSRFKANAYLTFNGVLFIATFLAFSVARGNRDSTVNSSDKKKSLLSKEERRAAKSSKSASSKKSSKSSRSSSKRSAGRSVTSKTSRSSRKSKGSRATSTSRSKSRPRSSSKSSKRTGSYA